MSPASMAVFDTSTVQLIWFLHRPRWGHAGRHAGVAFGRMASGGWDKQHRTGGGKEWTHIFELAQKVWPPCCVMHVLPTCRQAVCRCQVVRPVTLQQHGYDGNNLSCEGGVRGRVSKQGANNAHLLSMTLQYRAGRVGQWEGQRRYRRGVLEHQGCGTYWYVRRLGVQADMGTMWADRGTGRE